MLKELKDKLKIEVALVAPIRQKIRTTHDRERYDAWNEKRDRGQVRRHLHLAACYLRGTPFSKCESELTREPPRARWIADVLIEHGCVEGTNVGEAVVADVASWLTGRLVIEQGDDVPYTPKVPLRVRPEKLYIVVRADLPPGLQAAQAMHAQREFAERYPEIEARWHKDSNTVVILATSGEDDLRLLDLQLQEQGILAQGWNEPDLGRSLTAICVEPKGGQALRHLPLALRGKAA
jgi:hypothetical protein